MLTVQQLNSILEDKYYISRIKDYLKNRCWMCSATKNIKLYKYELFQYCGWGLVGLCENRCKAIFSETYDFKKVELLEPQELFFLKIHANL